MKKNLVIKWKGMFFTGSAWNPEYPEAKIFTSLLEARRIAREYDEADVWENYGFAFQEKVTEAGIDSKRYNDEILDGTQD